MWNWELWNSITWLKVFGVAFWAFIWQHYFKVVLCFFLLPMFSQLFICNMKQYQIRKWRRKWKLAFWCAWLVMQGRRGSWWVFTSADKKKNHLRGLSFKSRSGGNGGCERKCRPSTSDPRHSCDRRLEDRRPFSPRSGGYSRSLILRRTWSWCSSVSPSSSFWDVFLLQAGSA